MTPHQKTWAEARDQLGAALESLGYPANMADLIARELKSPRAIDRMTSYLWQARPRSLETIMDEMLAICADISSWREKKESEAAQAGYSAWLRSKERLNNLLDKEEE